MNKQILFCYTLLIILISGCSSDDGSQAGDDIQINNVRLEILSKTTNSIQVKVNYDSNKVAKGIYTNVLYKKKGESKWQEGNASILGLEPGTTYVVKGQAIQASNDAVLKQSLEVDITTKGFDHGTTFYADTKSFNRSYDFLINVDSKLSQAAMPLKGYIKVGNDSLELKNVEIVNDITLNVELPEDIQHFFENDDEYIIYKDFTVGLFSGDYYVEITDDREYQEGQFPEMSIFNKLPQFIKTNPIYSSTCSETDKEYWRIALKGLFWTKYDGFWDYTLDLYANPKDFTLKIYNTGGEVVFSQTMADDASLKNGSIDCGINSFRTFETVERFSYFHGTSRLHFQLLKEEFPEGEYQIQMIVTDQDDTIYESNLYDFTIEEFLAE